MVALLPLPRRYHIGHQSLIPYLVLPRYHHRLSHTLMLLQRRFDLPVLYGIRESSPDDPAAPGTPGSRPPAIAPGPRSDTAALPSCRSTHPERTAPPSDLLAPNTLWPAQLLQDTTPQELPLVPAPSPYLRHRPGCSQSPFLSERWHAYRPPSISSTSHQSLLR